MMVMMVLPAKVERKHLRMELMTDFWDDDLPAYRQWPVGQVEQS